MFFFGFPIVVLIVLKAAYDINDKNLVLCILYWAIGSVFLFYSLSILLSLGLKNIINEEIYTIIVFFLSWLVVYLSMYLSKTGPFRD